MSLSRLSSRNGSRSNNSELVALMNSIILSPIQQRSPVRVRTPIHMNSSNMNYSPQSSQSPQPSFGRFGVHGKRLPRMMLLPRIVQRVANSRNESNTEIASPIKRSRSSNKSGSGSKSSSKKAPSKKRGKKSPSKK